MNRRHASIAGLMALAVALFTLQVARAQTYPVRPVTIVVTAAAGGLTDLVARGVGQQLSEMWGKPVVIENRPGGDGLVAISTSGNSRNVLRAVAAAANQRRS